MSARFEERFVGPANSGLRKAIREAVAGAEGGEDRRRRVLSLSGVIALTASGRATLADVADDYATVPS